MKSDSDKKHFKECPNCNHSWLSRDKFLSDPAIRLVGYQAHFQDLDGGLFLFNHLSCKSTISVNSGEFRDLYNGPVYSKNMMGDEKCPEYCLFKFKLEPCPEECEGVFVREIIQIVKDWKKDLPANR